MIQKTVARAATAAAVIACGWIAYASGGARDPRPSLPGAAPAPLASAHGKANNQGEGTEIALRLLDALGDARVTAPNLDRGLMLLSAHWRKMTPPFSTLTGDNKKLATSIALRTSDSEVQWSVPTGSGGTWAPDARVWNMSEGSFDQREAIFAPSPCSIAFRVTVPSGGSITFAAGTANVSGDATTFRVVVHDGATTAVAFEERMLPEATKGWAERRADLSAFAGKSVELVLETAPSPRESSDPRPPPRAPRDPDAGVTEAVAPSGGPTLALWGNPTILSKGSTHVPYNVLFIVVDALRADAVASFHDDAEEEAARHAKYPPIDTLPRVAGLTPNLDALATKGVRFRHAYSGGSWTRPGTLSMLGGLRSTELGLDPLPWVLPDGAATRFYASNPPMLPLLLRSQGVATRAFVNNYFMVGYAPVGVDMGFERAFDHRFRTKDTALVTASAIAWMKEHKDERFLAFCNYNSPHEPWEPPARFLDRVPPPPAGPRDTIERLYMAEAAKDDEAIGVLLGTLDELGLRDHTIVVVTADHGETFSTDHDGVSDLDHMRVRYHHAVSNFEETTHVPILMSLPGVLPDNVAVEPRVRNTDIAPTLLELEGMDASPKMSGKSMMPLVRGDKEPDARLVLSEGRATRALMYSHYRLILREGKAQTWTRGEKKITVAEELYDLADDPGERHNLASQSPELLKEMKARLEAAKANVPAADAKAQEPSTADAPRIRLRFVGGDHARRVSGKLVAGDAKMPATLAFDLYRLPKDAARMAGGALELALVTSPEQAIGLDVRVDPPGAPLSWQLYLDDAPWPKGAVFTGPFGLYDASAETGLVDEASRRAAFALALPEIDPRRDAGLFVVRERKAEVDALGGTSGQGASEMAKETDRMLKEWGYAHGKSK